MKNKRGTCALISGYNKNLAKSKHAISTVVASVLLILITFLAIGIVWGFVLPMIRGNLNEGGSCFQLRDYVEVVQGDYTCYDKDNLETKIMIKRGMSNQSIKGFRVAINAGAESGVYDIVEDIDNNNIEMWDSVIENYEEDVKIPNPGETRSYLVIGIAGTKVDLGIITSSGSICEIDSYTLPRCI